MQSVFNRASRHATNFGWRSLLFAGISHAIRPVQNFIARLRFVIRTLPLRWARLGVPGEAGEYVIALTTYPRRIGSVWATIETLLRQSLAPREVVLVLSEDEFPERRLPRSLTRRLQRGLRILWIDRTLKSYNKFYPARVAFPDSRLVTVDDDILYDRDFAERLVRAGESHPGFIVGHRGWIPQVADRDAGQGTGPVRFAPYRTWMRHPAGPQTPLPDIFLTGVGGVLYPATENFDELALQIDVAVRLAPTADDVWLWAAAKSSSTPRHCTGERFGAPNGLEDLSGSLNSINVFGRRNDDAIAAVTHYFGLLSNHREE
jgi:hypothetical protein